MRDVMPIYGMRVSNKILLFAAKQMFFPVPAARYKFITAVKRAKFWVADNHKFLI